ncbi:MAG: asparagine synthase-related protein [Pusillimonas sp.]
MNISINITKTDWSKTIKNEFSEMHILGTITENEIFTKIMESNPDPDNLFEQIKDFTGFFSIIYCKNNALFACVDRIRSHPLFYAVANDCFYISDKADWVRIKVGETEMNSLARDEFQLTGYVTGQYTLYENVKQLQAGEALILLNDSLELKRYYTFEHSEPKTYNESELSDKFYEICRFAISRLVKYANGRQIVIPLSGGFDSRLIAVMLKENGYNNVLCFTYGLKGNKEAKYSKIVADSLGFKWHFVEYTKENWNKAWETQERIDYQLYSSNLTSLSHLQDWLAVKEMKEDGVLESNAVFSPGHTGDMISGSHIPKFIFEKPDQVYDLKDFVNNIIQKHYSLAPLKEVNTSKNVFEWSVSNSIRKTSLINAEVLANELEKWNWQERQAKFICNSVRVYEFFRYDWWLPMWDQPFVTFFENLPLKLRNHTWYKERVNELFKKYSSEKKQLTNASQRNSVLKFGIFLIKKIPFIERMTRFILSTLPAKSINTGYCGVSWQSEKLRRKLFRNNGIAAFFLLKTLEQDVKCNIEQSFRRLSTKTF